MYSENQLVNLPILNEKQVSLFIKREDLIHPVISGNKYRKLKYNLIQALKEKQDTLLTFGGAFSNHIAATAYAGKKDGFRTIGVIRGDELIKKWQNNPTLVLAHDHGMQFKFISRSDYRDKENQAYQQQLKLEFGRFYTIPEGGSNLLAVKGCEEILSEKDKDFNVICSAVGTGGTIAGLINSSFCHQEVLGFPVLKGDFLKEDIRKFATKKNWKLQTNYHFGGYARYTEELIHFINDFKNCTQIPLESIYTAKMIYGILDMIKNNDFKPQTKILAIHTGGLQGLKGMNSILKKKNLPLINI